MLGADQTIQKHWNLCCTGCCSNAAKVIIQLPIMSYSRMDYSVCQANAKSILIISGCKWVQRVVVVGLHSAGIVWYLQLPCVAIVLWSTSWRPSFRRLVVDNDSMRPVGDLVWASPPSSLQFPDTVGWVTWRYISTYKYIRLHKMTSTDQS